jgi:hypothetical protein
MLLTGAKPVAPATKKMGRSLRREAEAAERPFEAKRVARAQAVEARGP